MPPRENWSTLGVGGDWQLQGSRQRFSWSLHKTLLKNESWLSRQQGDKLVTEGHWFWHPAAKTIEGHFVAIDMPVTVFEYKTCFSGDTMINQLSSHDRQGNTTEYQETWQFQGADQYLWKLYQGGAEPVMQGVFRRVNND